MTHPEKPDASRRTLLAAAGLIVLATMAAYHNSLSGPFIYDDLPGIIDNRTIRHLGTSFFPPVGEGLTEEGRPVLNFSLALNYAISGTYAWSYHVLNLLIHMCAGLALFGIVRRTVKEAHATWFALAVALLWTLHPLQTEAVTYVIQRAESLMGLFYLLTLYCFIRGTEKAPNGLPWHLASVACCLAGMATKEVMVTAPVMLFFYDRTFAAGSFAEAWKRRKGYYLALASTWILLGILIASTGGNRSGSVGFGTTTSWGAYVLTQFEAIVTYLRLTVWPHPLVFEYGTFWVTPAQAAPYMAIVAVLAAATVWALVRRPALGFLGFWFFGILAPTSLAPGTTQMIVEHRMYLPLAAPAVLFVLAVCALMNRGRIVAVAGAAAGLGFTASGRNADYHSELAIWRDTAARRPENSRAHTNLADALEAAGRTPEALAEYDRALALNPNDAVANNNYAMTLAALGKTEDAVSHFERAVAIKPRYAHAHYNLANALAHLSRHDAAIAHYREALRIDPGYSEASNNLGNALLSTGRLDEALASFRTAIRLDPENAEACYNLGNALARTGHPSEAVDAYQQALDLRPDYADAHDNLGVALAQGKKYAEALAHFEEAVRLQPDYAEARLNLGNDLLLLDRPKDAAEQFRRALALKPDYAEARHGLSLAGGP